MNRLLGEPVDIRMRNRETVCVAVGFSAAVVATILGSEISPHNLIAPFGLLARAVIYTLLVFVAGAITTFWLLRVMVARREGIVTDIAVRAALPALWLPPLLMFSAQRSWFAFVIWAVLAVEVARLIAFLIGLSQARTNAFHESPSQGHMFALLNQRFPSGFASILGTLSIQVAAFAAVDGLGVLAGVLGFVGTVALVYRSVQMFQDASPFDHPNWLRRISIQLLAATFLIAFAWLPYIFSANGSDDGEGSFGGGSLSDSPSPQRGARTSTLANQDRNASKGAPAGFNWLPPIFSYDGSGMKGNSFAAARSLLELTLGRHLHGASPVANQVRSAQEGATRLVTGPVFPGIILYPETESPTKLVVPPPVTARGSGTGRADPLNISFNGVYWVWRGPADRPPASAVKMHGRPSAKTFRSTDGDPLSMEARQNLGFAVNLNRYRAIEVVIENADSYPGTVAIALRLSNTALPGKPSELLGTQQVSVPAAAIAGGAPRAQTLSFRVPNRVKTSSFDELAVRFYLKEVRGDRSPKIAIERFRLVPKD